MKKSLLLGATLAITAVISAPLMSAALLPNSATAEATAPQVKTAQITLEKTQEIQAKREALEQRLAEKRAAIGEKLSGERAETCEKKQDTINMILDQRVDSAQQHLDKLNAIYAKLAAFVTAKDLEVENASAFELIVNDKQTAAQAAVDAAKVTDFACTEADAAAPGKIVKDQMTAQKQALKDYRTAIKDYAVAIKSAAEAIEPENTEVTQ
jgi:hypothetical protein